MSGHNFQEGDRLVYVPKTSFANHDIVGQTGIFTGKTDSSCRCVWLTPDFTETSLKGHGWYTIPNLEIVSEEPQCDIPDYLFQREDDI